MKLVENAKSAWKWFSVQAMVLATAIQGAWTMLDSDMRVLIPYSDTVVPTITGALLVFGIIGRLVDQTPKP
jgi:hypothetical protein